MTDHDDLIRRALGDLLDAAPAPTDRPSTAPGAARTADRRPALVAAVLVTAAAALGATWIAWPGGDDAITTSSTSADSTSADSTDPAVTSTTSPAPTTTSPVPEGVDPAELSTYTGWRLPSHVPDGYDLTSVRAATPPTRSPYPTETWFRPAADGTADAAVHVTAKPAAELTVAGTTVWWPDDGRTVHGLPAQVLLGSGGVGAATYPMSQAYWEEAGYGVMVSARNVSEADMLAAAETVVLDPASGAVRFGGEGPLAGFEPIPLDPDVSDDGVVLELRYASADGGSVSVNIAPNDANETLGTVAAMNMASSMRVEHILLGDADAVQTHVPGADHSTIIWFDGGFRLEVAANVDAAEVARIAESVRPVTPGEVVAAGAAILPRTLALPVIDSVTFADGTTASLRGDRERHAIALCIDPPVQRCSRRFLSTGHLDRPAAGAFRVFRVGDQEVLVGWRAAQDETRAYYLDEGDVGYSPADPYEVIAAGPTVTSSESRAVSGPDDAGPVDEVALTATGQFVRWVVPPDAVQAMIALDDASAFWDRRAEDRSAAAGLGVMPRGNLVDF